jgi:effector-binding domain-containing protein
VRLLKPLLIILIVLLLLLAGIGWVLPRRVHIERSTSIEAPAATVFALVDGFGMFNQWSPWYGLDPSAQFIFEGPSHGVGAQMTWQGDAQSVGSGTQKIVESRPFEQVRSTLEMGYGGLATSQFTLTPDQGRTKVTWGLDADLGFNPVIRYLGLMLEDRIGPDYERGLDGLKKLAERLPKFDFAGLTVQEVEVPPAVAAYAATSCDTQEQSILQALRASYAKVGKFMAARRLTQAGPAFTINLKFAEDGYEFEAAIPLDRAPEEQIPLDSPVKIKRIYSGKALKATHDGPYQSLDETLQKLSAYAAAYGYEPAASSWEEADGTSTLALGPQRAGSIFLPVK